MDIEIHFRCRVARRREGVMIVLIGESRALKSVYLAKALIFQETASWGKKAIFEKIISTFPPWERGKQPHS